MNAFVKVNNGTFPNLNFYMAWEGLNTMGYSVTLFEEKDLDTLPITPATPVFAGVTVFRKVMEKIGVKYDPFNCYPDVLAPYYKRKVEVSTLGEQRHLFHTGERTFQFVKPVIPKQFLGKVWRSTLDLISLANVPDDTQVYVCPAVPIDSEFRVYVHDRDILGVKHYFGDWYKTPKKEFVAEVVRAYKSAPIAYGIDIGVNGDGNSFVLEVNDGCNLGNYGIDSIHYGEMIVSRWFEICATEGVEKYIENQMEISKRIDAREGGTANEDHTRGWYTETGSFGRTMKDFLTKVHADERKMQSMKAYAEDIVRRIREEGEEP